jgi:hypothetical protein
MIPSLDLPSRRELPSRQREALEQLERFYLVEGVPPTFAELAELLGLSSTNSVSRLLRALVDRGFLREREGSGSRSFVPLTVSRLRSRFPRGRMLRVLIVAPGLGWLGDLEKADDWMLAAFREYARRVVVDSEIHGEAPLVPQLCYTSPPDGTPGAGHDRKTELRAWEAWEAAADLIAVYQDEGISPPMKAAVERARARGQAIEWRHLLNYRSKALPELRLELRGAEIDHPEGRVVRSEPGSSTPKA